MRIIRSVIVAFSMYSRIPMPQFRWEEADTKYMLCFFPWVGAVTGAAVWFFTRLCEWRNIGLLCETFAGAAIPLLITGGFHADGFLDTSDALHSYQSRDRKLEILKDSHVGAFAVIRFAIYGLLYLAAFSEIQKPALLQIFCAGFFLARCLSGISVVCFQTARKDGMLSQTADQAEKRIVRVVLCVQTVVCVAFMLWRNPVAGVMVTVVAFAVFAWYYYKTRKEFGGVTGDTAGYFVLLCELAILLTLAVTQKWG